MTTLTKSAAVILLVLGAPLSFAQQAGGNPSPDADMANMDAIMERIRGVEDPDERAELLDQHLDEMHAEMARMLDTMGQLMQQVEQQRSERRRLHNHRKLK